MYKISNIEKQEDDLLNELNWANKILSMVKSIQTKDNNEKLIPIISKFEDKINVIKSSLEKIEHLKIYK